jgi:hypothetical protein
MKHSRTSAHQFIKENGLTIMKQLVNLGEKNA